MREFVRELTHQGVSVWLIDMPLWSPRKLPFNLRDPWFETLNQPTGANTTLHFCMPHQVRPVPGLRNVNYTMFEATPAPAPWVEKNLEHDLVIVPTESSRAAWIAGGMPAERIPALPPQCANPRLLRASGGAAAARIAGWRTVARYVCAF